MTKYNDIIINTNLEEIAANFKFQFFADDKRLIINPSINLPEEYRYACYLHKGNLEVEKHFYECFDFSHNTIIINNIVDIDEIKEFRFFLKNNLDDSISNIIIPAHKINIQFKKRPKITIFGSCVSRDCFSTNEFDIVSYYARTSFSSQNSQSISLPNDITPCKSQFEQRIFLQDFSKDIFQKIHEDESDIVVLDFVDERFDKLEMFDSILVKSDLLLNSNIIDKFDNNLIDHEKEFELFKIAFDRFINLNKNKKIILLKVFFANSNLNGEHINNNGFKEYLDKLKLMYDYVESNHKNVIILKYSDFHLIADPKHKWGPAAYHYRKEFYQFTKNFIQTRE